MGYVTNVWKLVGFDAFGKTQPRPPDIEAGLIASDRAGTLLPVKGRLAALRRHQVIALCQVVERQVGWSTSSSLSCKDQARWDDPAPTHSSIALSHFKLGQRARILPVSPTSYPPEYVIKIDLSVSVVRLDRK